MTNEMLERNARWAQEQLENNPDYFKEMALGQHPQILWIGCADSRVPANEITGCHAGDMFVHRNIANMVIHTDFNILSVLEYAVHHLEVKHIIICGHYGCGGVGAAMSHDDYGIINKWVRNIKDVYRIHSDEINQLDNDEEKLKRLVELNVQEQVRALSETSIVQKAWEERGSESLFIHGWVYDMNTGLLKDLGLSLSSKDQVDEIYRFERFQ